jgi:WD40 repeat protein
MFYLVRTGQAHRTLMGHTGPVTCLQFDEMHIASGSLDKSIRVCTLISLASNVLKCRLRYGTSGQAAHLKPSSMIML